MSDLRVAARALLARERQAVLATVSVRRQGWPFASIAPYALGADGDPLLLLSDLAEHTRNLKADPRASLLVQAATAGDPQASGRLTLLGEVSSIENADGDAVARYVDRHPEAAAYLQMDFRLYRLAIQEVRFIAGFGDMGWISGTDFKRPS